MRASSKRFGMNLGRSPINALNTSEKSDPALDPSLQHSPKDQSDQKRNLDSLSDMEFVKIFKMTRAQFDQQPVWKRDTMKKVHGFI